MQKNVVQTYINALEKQGIVKSKNVSPEILNQEIDCVSYDTRKLNGSSIFICKGANFKDEYAKQAFENGAILYVSEKTIDKLDSYIVVDDIRAAIVTLAQTHFQNSHKNVKAIGITGTKGKGCVAYFLRSIINTYMKTQNKADCALLSSVRTYDGVQDFESHLTTPETMELYENFNNAYKSGIEYLVMEVSSLAIKFGRTQGINYEVACFTNFDKDHISEIEHPDIEDYFESKLKIFDTAKNACVNLDCNRSDQILQYAKSRTNVLTFGSNNKADVYCSGINSKNNQISFHVYTPKFEDDVLLNTTGLFNVSNAMAAISISLLLNIPQECILQGLKDASIPGRMLKFSSKDQKLTFVVDYAHNKLSFEALYDSLSKEYEGSSICAAFGCPGFKSYDRRLELPLIASQYCDYICICEEDSGTEKFENIANDIAANIKNCKYDIIENRDSAIASIINNWDRNKNLVIAFTGKGDECYMKRGNNYEDYVSDVEIAKKYIEKYNNELCLCKDKQ